MGTRSTIMDTNSFRPEHAAELDHATRKLTDKRNKILGESYRLFYRNPVHLVKGQGQYLWDAAGHQYLDVYNNVASIGHCHPAVIEAVNEQMKMLNTHTRYLHENILDYTEELLQTTPDEIDRAMYMCTGSEANDLAIRIAREYSGGTGIIVSQESYHGTSSLTSGCSPALGTEQPLDATTRLVPAPDYYRIQTDDLGTWFAQQIQQQIDDMNAKGIKFAGFWRTQYSLLTVSCLILLGSYKKRLMLCMPMAVSLLLMKYNRVSRALAILSGALVATMLCLISLPQVSQWVTEFQCQGF